MNNSKRTGYIVRSNINPKLYLCTNGDFLAKDFFGPGHRVGVRIYKTIQRALQARRPVDSITVEEYSE